MRPDGSTRGDRSNRIVLALSCAGVLAIGALFSPLLAEDVLATSKVPFDSATWRAKADPWWSVPMRVRMLSDLVTSGKLVALDRARVLELLGPSDPCERLARPRRELWRAGPWRTDDLWLAVDTSEDGLVVDASIVN